LSKKLYPQCLVRVGSRNGFKCDLHKKELLILFTVKLKYSSTLLQKLALR